MNRDEQSLIQNLFGKLSDAERNAPPREAEAERFINDSVSRQPGAPYYMAQTIIMQEQALEAASARIQQLEQQTSRPQSSGGFFGSLFGGGASQASRQPARAPYAPQGAYGQPQGQGAPQQGQAPGPWGGNAPGAGAYAAGRPGGGGGFLAGAAQTAMGVAGGMMLGSMLSNAFSDPAAAVEGAVADAGEAVETEVAEVEEDFGGFDEA
ncbi:MULTISPECIES: DUF2076 domain-containing protein [unclassified Aureimonas]|uniref:DUF2076 domain-containing protein n=1 Tax=unclassified Aureimonas TaxID=2615206 RepID=UPI0006F77DD3|nr:MULTISPECIES: DUF2076 domain-containing protein [unclassified Aureimonas]KQT53037.1 hypothetical protein ASG62_14145 [Aureimonas sp. Leaf427]KQT80493.1 hypothetical protein ASG54_07995 [Aureimonas sp. Leaf460]